MWQSSNQVVILGALLALASPSLAQQVPRVYPEPAPTPPDSARHAPDLRDQQQFAVPSVVGMGPSKGIILHYERTAPYSVASTANVVSLSDFSTQAYRTGRLIFKGYILAWNRPHLKVLLGR